MQLSIIILSYNTQNLLRSCLASIYNKLKGLEFEVIVFDNASSDGSSAMVRRDFKQVSVIDNDANVGFSKGVNAAVKQAKGKFLLFLNSDTKLIDDSVKEMVLSIEKDQDVAVVGGMMKNSDGSTSESYGKFYNLTDVFQLLFLKRSENHQEKSAKGVDWVSGGFMLMRKEDFEKMSGFDEHFFMYLEDMELCYRLKKLHRKVIHLPSARVMHVGQGSSNRSFAIVQIYKGLLYFYKKHKPYWQYVVVKSMLLTKAVLLVVFGTATKNEYLRNTYRKALQF